MAEAERQLTEFKNIGDRHEGEIKAYLSENPQQTNGLSEQAWRNVLVVDMICQLGAPEVFDHDFHEICRKHRAIAELSDNFNFETFFTDTAIVCGLTPLYKTLWSLQGWLDTAYCQPANITDAAKFDVMLWSLMQQDAALLDLYLEIFRHLGENRFLQTIGAGDPDRKV